MLRVLHDKGHAAREEEMATRVAEIKAEREKYLNTEEGESLNMDDMADIYCQAKGEQREKYNFSLTTRGKSGDISDYLETRRPFGAPA